MFWYMNRIYKTGILFYKTMIILSRRRCFFASKFFEMLKTSLGRLRVIGFLEGLSFLVLLGIAMPLKYMFEMPEPNKVIGMAHGVLFVLYVMMTIQVKIEHSWNFKRTMLVLLASIVPFGTFYAD